MKRLLLTLFVLSQIGCMSALSTTLKATQDALYSPDNLVSKDNQKRMLESDRIIRRSKKDVEARERYANDIAILLKTNSLDVEQRYHLLAVFTNLGASEASTVKVLALTLNDSDPKIVLTSLEFIKNNHGPKELAPQIVTLLDVANKAHTYDTFGQIQEVKYEASKAILGMGIMAIPYLDKIGACCSRSPWELWHRIRELGPEGVSFLLKLSVSDNGDERQFGLYGMKNDMISESDVPALAYCLEHQDPKVRMLAILVLTDLGPLAKGALSQLEKIQTSDPDPQVRSQAEAARPKILGVPKTEAKADPKVARMKIGKSLLPFELSFGENVSIVKSKVASALEVVELNESNVSQYTKCFRVQKESTKNVILCFWGDSLGGVFLSYPERLTFENDKRKLSKMLDFRLTKDVSTRASSNEVGKSISEELGIHGNTIVTLSGVELVGPGGYSGKLIIRQQQFYIQYRPTSYWVEKLGGSSLARESILAIESRYTSQH